MKKATSLILVLAMLLSVLTLSGLAVTSEHDHDHEGECDTCMLDESTYSTNAICACGNTMRVECQRNYVGSRSYTHQLPNYTSCSYLELLSTTANVCDNCMSVVYSARTHGCYESGHTCGLPDCSICYY